MKMSSQSHSRKTEKTMSEVEMTRERLITIGLSVREVKEEIDQAEDVVEEVAEDVELDEEPRDIMKARSNLKLRRTPKS